MTVQPKTIEALLEGKRSGEITRGLLRDIAENRQLGGTTTLADSTIVAELQRRCTEEESKEP